MSPPDQQEGLPLGRPSAKVADDTTPPDPTSPRQKSPTQRDKVLSWLLSEEAVCSTTLLGRYVPRGAAIVHLLRSQGFVIVSRPCSRRHEHANPQIEYVLEALPFDPSDGAA